jgi:hypothetical protein
MGGMGGGAGMRGGMGGGMGGLNVPLPALPGAVAPPVGPADEGGQFSARAFRHYQTAQIVLDPREQDAPYLKQLRAADRRAYSAYLCMRPQYARSPDFFLDCFDFFFDRQETELAIQILSNLAELGPDDVTLLREMGHRLARAGAYDLAVEIFEDVLQRRPDEPQSYRDLAMLLVQRAEETRAAMNAPKPSRREPPDGDDRRVKGRGKADAASDYARAVELLTEIVIRRWDSRFAEIELPVLMDLNRLLARTSGYGVSHKGLDPRLVRLLDLDLRIVATWSATDSGFKLVVTEPSGEKAKGDQRPTKIGGLVSRSAAVYGPEEYLVRRAMKGEYLIEAVFTNLAGPPRPVTVQVDIFTNFGRDREQHRSLAVRLDGKTSTLGQVKF